mgnify:CR=1 FL=1
MKLVNADLNLEHLSVKFRQHGRHASALACATLAVFSFAAAQNGGAWS